MTERRDHSHTTDPTIASTGREAFPDALIGLPGLVLAGGQAFVARQGAQVLSWHDRSGRERLYLSPQTGGFRRGDAADILHQPIRGGIPVSFPQFSGRGPLPKHGFARNLLWHPASSQPNPSESGTKAVTLALRDDAQTLALWPHAFQTEISVSCEADALSVSLAVTNSGTMPWSFTAALHTYLRVANIQTTALTGLQGTKYQDATAGNAEEIQKEGELRIDGEVDRVYMMPPGPLVLLENGVPSLKIEQQGFFDTVVWNLGPINARALKDFPDDDWLRMVCVEAACAARPVNLSPGDTWRGQQRLTVISAAA